MNKNMDIKLIAPCGINCGACIAFFGYTMSGKKRKYKCNGCWSRERPCAFIKKKCKKLSNKQIQYCFECTDFPCENLSILDKRYREKYGFSLVENLEHIQKKGIDEFLKYELERWECPNCAGIVCVHDKKCYTCRFTR
jgi:hypothetical protein